MDIAIIIISIIAIGCVGWAILLFSENKSLSKNLENQRKKGNDLQNKLSSANDQVKSLKTDRAKVSESNANALWRLHLAQVSLEAGAIAFYAERAKSDRFTKTYRELYDKHKELIEETNQNAQARIAWSGIKLAANLVPFLGAFLEAGEVIESVVNAGEAATDSSNILGVLESAMEKFEISGVTSISAELPIDLDINDTPFALTEEVQNAFNGAFEEHLMESEKLDPSNFRDFATDAIQRTGDAEALKLLTEEALINIYSSFIDFGIGYYDYHKTRKLELPEDASVSDKPE